MREFCDTIAASFTRYDKYRCWASKYEVHGIATPATKKRDSINAHRAHTKGVMQPHAILRRVLRRFSNNSPVNPNLAN